MSDSDMLRLTIGTEFNECSLATAELSASADRITQNPANYLAEHALVIEPLGIADEVLDIAPLSREFTTPGGRPVRMVLGFDSENSARPPRLLVQAQGGVSLPVASFARRQGSPCDFVQIGAEVTNENVIVTPGDQATRKDLIDDLRTVLSGNPMALLWGPRIKKATERQRDFTGQRSKEVSAAKKKIDTLDTYPTKALELIAVLDAVRDSVDDRDKSTYEGIFPEVEKKALSVPMRARRFRAAQQRVGEFLEHPDMEALADGTALGGGLSEYALNGLLIAIGHKAGLQYDRYGYERVDRDWPQALAQFYRQPDSYGWQPIYTNVDPRNRASTVERLLTTLHVDEIFDRQLGPYSPEYAEIVNHLSRIVGSYWVGTDRFNIHVQGSPVSVDLKVEAIPAGTEAHQVVVSTRPTHQPGQSETDMIREVVHRSQPNSMSPDVTSELRTRISNGMAKDTPPRLRPTRSRVEMKKRRFRR